MADISGVSCLDEKHKPEKGIYKRRSSIFSSRIITCNQQKGGNKSTNNETSSISRKNDKEENNIHIDTKSFNLKEYIEKLKQEQKDWQQEYKKRKIQRKNLTKQKKDIEEQGQILDMNVLTESEKNFLMARPNYEQICKNNQNLLDMTLKISILNQIVQNSNEQFIEKMENNISKAIRSVINMSKE